MVNKIIFIDIILIVTCNHRPHVCHNVGILPLHVQRNEHFIAGILEINECIRRKCLMLGVKLHLEIIDGPLEFP